MSKPANNSAAAAVPATPNDWRVAGHFLRTELRRHDLSHREMLLAELVLEKTYGWERAEIVFPQLRFFTDLTGIDEPDVTRILARLCARKIVRIRRVKGQPTYAIRPDTDKWKALPRVTRETMAGALNLMREWNGLEPLPLEKDANLNFKNGADAYFLDGGIGNSPMGGPMGGPMGELKLNLT